jgi:hypothetical protein
MHTNCNGIGTGTVTAAEYLHGMCSATYVDAIKTECLAIHYFTL